MNESFLIHLGRESLLTALLVVGPVMLVGFVVGIAVSFLQAITSIQEMTLAFVPKLLAIGIVIIVAGHWMLSHLSQYTIRLLGGFPNMISL